MGAELQSTFSYVLEYICINHIGEFVNIRLRYLPGASFTNII